MTLPELANAPSPELDLFEAYLAYLKANERGNRSYASAARRFFERWHDPMSWAAEPLEVRLSADAQTRPLLTFLMLHSHLHPGYDYLVSRTLTSLWREIPSSPLTDELERFITAARQLGFSKYARFSAGSQVIARLLIQTRRRLGAITESDLDALAEACRARQESTGARWRHYSRAIYEARQVLFHLGVLDQPPIYCPSRPVRSLEERMADLPGWLRSIFVSYLERLVGTHARSTILNKAYGLFLFGSHLVALDPALSSLAELDRRRHIEPYLTAVARATKHDGTPLSVAERRRRVLDLSCFLNDITEWGWPEAPSKRLMFRSDLPRLPRPLPRYIPLDADRRLRRALEASANRLLADALLLLRATGIRIGELLSLELDCVHEVSGLGAWLKVPLGKFDTERMVPLDDETVAIVDRLVAQRGPQRALRHPRHGRMVDFLMVHYGRRVSASALRAELHRAAIEAGLNGATPHQLRHTYATALVNHGVTLQQLMALLGHQSAEMSLRYGRLFDATIRESYERALALAKARLGPVLPKNVRPIKVDTDWRSAPLIKARLAGGYCLRTVAQGSCPYANICEFCPSFRSDAGFLAVLGAQRADAEALAKDAEERGWGEEVARHRHLIDRLDLLLARAQAG